MAKRPSCGKATLRRSRVREAMFGVDLGEFEAETCPACEESFLSEAAMLELEQRARKAGVWGLGEKVKVTRSGNSLMLRIPSELARFLKIKPRTEVVVHPEGEDRIVVDVEG